MDQKEGTYSVGASLKDKVKNFIGLAGANLGLTTCLGLDSVPVCSKIDGFNPGPLPSTGPSLFLTDLNANAGA